MRYVLFFNEDNKMQSIRHYEGKKLNPDEEVKKLTHPNFKRFSEQMLIDLCDEGWQEKVFYLELNENDDVFLNQNRFIENLKNQYEDGQITQEELQGKKEEGVITQEEYDYIVSTQ